MNLTNQEAFEKLHHFQERLSSLILSIDNVKQHYNAKVDDMVDTYDDASSSEHPVITSIIGNIRDESVLINGLINNQLSHLIVLRDYVLKDSKLMKVFNDYKF